MKLERTHLVVAVLLAGWTALAGGTLAAFGGLVEESRTVRANSSEVEIIVTPQTEVEAEGAT